MSEIASTPRFRANPVEIVIFLVALVCFSHSLYNLIFFTQSGHGAPALLSMTANPISEGRTLASTSKAFSYLDLSCDPNQTLKTEASKVRLSGALCDLPAVSESNRLEKTAIVNVTNRYSATVFTDLNAAKYSTDFIPLNLGANMIHLEFFYKNGKTVSKDLVLTKN